MSDGRGNIVLTSRAIDVSTSRIMNPVRLSTKGDDVLGLIAQLSTKLNNEMRLPAMQVGQAGLPAAADVKVEAKAEAKAEHAEAKAVHHDEKAAEKTEHHAVKAETKVAKAESKSKQKMDIRTAMLYSKALEEEDAGNKSKAVELYRQVVAKFPLPAAQSKIEKLSRS